ncbi:MAG: xylS [Paenibacillus sp.]|nr:xylS [Paenibacillus sp.]
MKLQTNDGVLFKLANGGWMHIDPVASHTFRIRLNNTGTFSASALHRYGICSEPSGRCFYTTEHDEHTVKVRTEAVALHANTSDGQFRFGDDRDRTCLHTVQAPLSSCSDGFDIRFRLAADEAVYGLGDVVPERINRRGLKVDMWVAGTNFHSPVPFFMSSCGWAILMNTTWKHTIDIGHEHEHEIRIAGSQGELDFYIFYGNDYGELLHRYTDISGKPQLLPLWAYGLHYFCSAESGGRQVVEDALKFRQEGIPCDLIGLSHGWMEEESGSGTKTWDIKRFVVKTHPSQESSSFIDTLHRHGFKISLMLFYDDRDVSGYGGQHLASLSSAEERTESSWYDQLATFVEDGVDAFKIPSANLAIAHPERRYANGMSDNELHNLQPILLYKQMYEGYRKQTGKRPMIHAVVGFTGMQQYMATECGKYGSRATSVLSALNSGLSGHAHTAIQMHVAEPEGIHAAFLLPWSQNNSGRHFRHPCFQEEKQRSLFRMYARLRYRLLPYVYTAAHTAARTGMPIARAMPIAFPDDPLCRDLGTQYMLGNDLLAAVFTYEVYLPPGLWFDFWTDKRYEGPCTIRCDVPEHAGGPLFVRAGAILPMRPDMDYIGQEAGESITLHVYPHGESESELFEDDGISFQYADGQMATTRFRCHAEQNRIVISIWRRSGSYEGMPGKRSYEIVVHIADKPSMIRVNGVRLSELKPHSARKKTPTGWKYERMAGTLRLIADESPFLEEPVRIEIGQRNIQRESSGEEKGSPEQASTSGSSKTAEDTLKWLHIALDTGVLAEVEAALTTWWNSRFIDSESASHWRTGLLDGCILLIRHAERRGWRLGERFGQHMANPLSHAEVQTPEQAVALLRQLASEVIDAAKSTIEPIRHPIIRETVAYVQRELHTKLSLQQFAERAGIHPVYLSRLFKKKLGLPFSDYVLQQRMERAKALLESGMKVYEAGALCGIQDASHFSRVYSKYWGSAPVHFRKK